MSISQNNQAPNESIKPKIQENKEKSENPIHFDINNAISVDLPLLSFPFLDNPIITKDTQNDKSGEK